MSKNNKDEILHLYFENKQGKRQVEKKQLSKTLVFWRKKEDYLAGYYAY